MQQPVTSYGTSQLAIKFVPSYKRIARDFNAPPYQGRIAPGKIPLGYHYVSEYYTLNANENPSFKVLFKDIRILDNITIIFREDKTL